MSGSRDALREEMKRLSRRYFEEHYSPDQEKFVAGETYVPASAKRLDADDLEMLIEASLDLWLTAGRFSAQFEAELPARFDRKIKALLVNSGSSANLLAFSSLLSPMLSQMGRRPIVPGDEVITVAAGFPTTVNPILQNGCVPVFVDVDLETHNVRPDDVAAAITPKTRAVMIAHTLGNPYRSDQIAKLCAERGLYFVEDCCDALGSRIEGKSVGSFADYATVSFYPAHHITMGEGGAVVARNIQFRRIAESVRDWGRDCWCDAGKDNTCGKLRLEARRAPRRLRPQIHLLERRLQPQGHRHAGRDRAFAAQESRWLHRRPKVELPEARGWDSRLRDSVGIAGSRAGHRRYGPELVRSAAQLPAGSKPKHRGPFP
jgi:CDP-4-dehydro-6-deoxyglucose reductase, E1